MRLSILIPSKQEKWLDRTIAGIYASRALPDTQVLFMEDDGRGQRKCTNELAKKAKGDYVMKLDAHCQMGPSFDRILLEEMDDLSILAPMLLPLDGETWSINGKKQMMNFAFGPDFVMRHEPESPHGFTMSLQGSCWVVRKDRYWEWNLGDETLPSWGGQGTELGIKAFLNGGVCRVTRRTFYGHVFRHADEDFPYKRDEDKGKNATDELMRRYKNKKLAPLIARFGYPAGWSPEVVNSLPDCT